MELVHAVCLLLLFCSACSSFESRSEDGLFLEDPELVWARMETMMSKEMTPAPAPETKLLRSASGSGSPEAKNVPQYLAVPASQTLKQVFKPEQGARSLPNLANEMLLVTAAPTPAIGATAGTKLVEILCHVDRMYVRIKREVFKTRDAYKYLTLGTCPVNKGTKEHYYLEYLLRTECGFEKKVGKAVPLNCCIIQLVLVCDCNQHVNVCSRVIQIICPLAMCSTTGRPVQF